MMFTDERTNFTLFKTLWRMIFMTQHLIKAGEKNLCGFGIGTGMGVSFHASSSNEHILQNNCDLNGANDVSKKCEFQNVEKM